MNYTALTFALVFLVFGIVFPRAVKSSDPTIENGKRLAAILFFLAAAAFLVAFVISLLNSGGAR